MMPVVKRKYVVFAFTIFMFFLLIVNRDYNYEVIVVNRELIPVGSVSDVTKWVHNRRTQAANLSALGRLLYLNEAVPAAADQTFEILVWKYGKTIESRHLKNFSNKRIDPFEKCSVSNCNITYSDAAIETADIVIYHLHRMKGIADLPKAKRNPKQIWAFLTDESPYHTFLNSKTKLKDFNGVFNWSMTYKINSDIPVPYGRTVLKAKPEKFMHEVRKRSDVLVAVMGSNCGGNNHRWNYIRKLQNFIKVDVYGGCGPIKTCPGHFKSDCPDLNNYLFYLSFENSNCNEYITEKLWWNAFEKNAIPIVMGGNVDSYEKLLPPNSYIDVDTFAHPAALAQYLYYLNQTGNYAQYYQWKDKFEVRNEHGYFKSTSYHFCRVCEALNYNDKSRKIYKDLESFWSVKKDCYKAWDK